MLRKSKEFTDKEIRLMFNLVNAKCHDIELAINDYEELGEEPPVFLIEDSIEYNSLFNKLMLMDK